jgi:tRNA pseudouridine synthase 9
MMQKGSIRVNNTRIDDHYILTGDETITLDGIMHLERPVPYPHTIEIIHEDDQYLVVNKPHGIPVQPGEPFFKNTLLHILQDDYNKHDLKRKINQNTF